MNKYLISFVLTLMSLSLFSQKGEHPDMKGIDRWWFGANVGLNFGSDNNSSVFYMGLFPMAGFKILPNLSVGPRLGFAFESKRIQLNRVEKVTLLNLSEAAFARYKVFNYFFVHGEFETVQLQNEVWNNILEKFDKSWGSDENAYLGIGYNSGGKVASEIYILYNFLLEDNTLRQPFEFRAGLTYNF